MIDTIAVALILGIVLVFKEWKIAEERREWAAERAQLLQRIQAPEQAITDFSQSKKDEIVFPIPFDDDEEAFRAREQMNLNGDS